MVKKCLNSLTVTVYTVLVSCHVPMYVYNYRYSVGSIKESTRSERDQGASRVYTLHPATRLPSQKVILTVSSNKKQIIDLIVADLEAHSEEIRGKLVVTGNDPVPVEICHGLLRRREDMAITHEEADTMIIQQLASARAAKALVVADDTDVFVLLCHFVFLRNIHGHVMMVSPVRGRACIDINASVEKNRSVMGDVLAAHGLTGCDTVATYHGIGKGTALKTLKSGKHTLSKVGDSGSTLPDVLQQSTRFMLSCYGHPECESMTSARLKVWSAKVSRSIGGAPKLQTLPPTDEAFSENVARAHLQVAIWREAMAPNPPDMDPLAHGWTQLRGSTSLTPRGVADNVAIVPDDILRLIKCSCDSDMPCKSKRCGCHNASMACTEFCACGGGDGCFNQKTRECRQEDAESENEDDSTDNL